ncbi:protein tramtrack, alpha isoform isoform X2 [Culex pipiens pallens]|uniref:protein tramtrack, alpha isoform isoform X2 n=1 Tax=Culex pipiens pallens TaxID=42434 RepID=UPI001952A545|nr:protein tramtrack, alpha isoform isoform X2 [Culex pipiens pallens]
MSSQRFCLRWNNHQTNMLSVFDQLLHAETFTDVTLAIEGQYLKAHKMVLSACSPYFQQIFVNHPEKHPIVILKDVPFKDMKCLLDFMYRGEVSVDQDRLAAFLRVAESLRIKGLTEVNDDKPPLPTASLTSSGVTATSGQNAGATAPSTPTQQQLQQQLAAAASRNTQLASLQQQPKQKSNGGGQSMLLTNPLLGSALSQQKRKRGRPRKLSGSDNGDGEYDGYESDTQGSPDLMEVKLAADGMSNSGDENVISRSAIGGEDDAEDSMDTTTGSPPAAVNNNVSSINKNANSSSSPAPSGPAANATTNNTNATNNSHNAKSSASSLRNENSMSALADKPEITIIPQFSKPAQTIPNPPSPPTATITPMDITTDEVEAIDDDDAEDEEDSDSELEFIMPKFEPAPEEDCSIVEQPESQDQTKQQQQLFLHQLQQQHLQNLHQAKMRLIQQNGNGNVTIGSDPEDQELCSPETPLSSGRTPSQDSFDGTPHAKQPSRRRARRKNLSPDDQAEALTEMSVRGLNLFRYAQITDGVYQCMECAKESVQKTFKNKYSFQRHAFLYHEGAQRKVFPCPVCNKEFSRPDKMKNHLKTTHESYTAKVDNGAVAGGYPLNFVIEQHPPQQPNKIESAVLSAIQLHQHLNMQKELHSQQAKFHQLISPNKDGGVAPATIVVGTHNGSQ